jgi:hypothetical protein
MLDNQNSNSPAQPLSEDEAAILKEAEVLIEAFGSTASVAAKAASLSMHHLQETN